MYQATVIQELMYVTIRKLIVVGDSFTFFSINHPHSAD